ncbi:hypothetical protein ABIB50_005091 [Mucilaginibacter sp. UYCu711]
MTVEAAALDDIKRDFGGLSTFMHKCKTDIIKWMAFFL